MTTNILTYISNLYAGKVIINRIYNYVNDARYIMSIGGCKKYLINIPNIGKQYYTSSQLVRLDNKAFCSSLDELFSIDIDDITLDEYILILLKGKNEILKLYQAYYNAEDKETYGGLYCLTFTNPYINYVELNKNKILLRGSEIISLNNNVISFNARLVITNE